MVSGTGADDLCRDVGRSLLSIVKRDQNSPTLLGQLLGVWVMLAIVFPSISRPIIENSVSIPSGADIQMTQREAVNDAWDLPKEATMDAFVGRHPEWASYTAVERPFEWKWYFAFQQVGDQAAESLSTAYAEGRMHRDQLGWGCHCCLHPHYSSVFTNCSRIPTSGPNWPMKRR